jgi:hypothetical protein
VSEWQPYDTCDAIVAGLKRLERLEREEESDSHLGEDGKTKHERRRNGIERSRKKKTRYVNLNRPFERRCMSPSGIFGGNVDEHLRDVGFDNWERWSGTPAPERVSWECCAQFLTTREGVLARKHSFWKRMYRALSLQGPHGGGGSSPPWEYLWPTMIDEEGTADLAKHLC